MVLIVLSVLAMIMAATAAAAGILLRGHLETVATLTPRGEVVDLLVGGIYRFNGEAIAAEGIGWDLVTLLVVAPAMLLAATAVARGSVRGRLVVAGLLAYLVYQYAEYATFLAYGPLFPLYVAILGVSISGLAVAVAGIDVSALEAAGGGRFPRRGVIVLGAYIAVLLTGMWLPLVARTASATTVEELDGATTLVVQAFDLGLLVPLGIFTAWTAARRMPAMYVLAPIVVVKASAMGLAIAAMLVIEYLATGVLALVPIGLFLATALASGVLGWRVFASLGPRAYGAAVAGDDGTRPPTPAVS